jgi:hypothetical protein
MGFRRIIAGRIQFRSVIKVTTTWPVRRNYSHHKVVGANVKRDTFKTNFNIFLMADVAEDQLAAGCLC